MAATSEREIQGIIDSARKRSRSHVGDYFRISKGIRKFAEENVIAHMEQYEIPITSQRFRHEFISAGIGKLGFNGYIQKVVPKIHTQEEFDVLLKDLGYEAAGNFELDEPLRVLICGSRDWGDAKLIRYIMEQLPRNTIIIEGGARGADTLAASIADQLGFAVEEYPADWSMGKSAGYIRNRQMLEEGKPDLVIAFSEDIRSSKGTLNMVKQAKKAEVPIRIFTGQKRSPKLGLDEFIDFG